MEKIKNFFITTIKDKSRENFIEDIEKMLDLEKTPLNKGLFFIIIEAIKWKASDIHIESLLDKVRIRFRIDGFLKEIVQIDKDFLAPIVSKIKILSSLDIVEKRKPQDGRFSLKYKNREIDIRTSFIPTVHGEKIVLRILDKFNNKLSIDDLYLSENNKKLFLKNINRNNGIILINGPTGSGKSTTLYTILKYKNKEEINISTVEDPIEYHIEGVNQTQCKTEIGLDFATMLRAILRQDPDVIMIGEIRDKETAEIAIKAALTGHLVFSTIHSNNALSCINRLKNLGLDNYLLSLVIEMIVSQRLVRKLCPDCKIIDTEAMNKLESLGITGEIYKNSIFYKACGCEKCMGIGYIGRLPIFEVLDFNEENKTLFFENRDKISGNLNTLLYDGIEKASQGLTSLDELLRLLWKLKKKKFYFLQEN